MQPWSPTVFVVDPLSDPRWSELTERHARGGIFHSVAWLKSLQRTYGYKPVAYTTSCPGKRLENALLFCNINSWLTGRRLVSLPFTDHCDPLVQDSTELQAILSAVERRLHEERWRYIEMRPCNDYHAVPSLARITYAFAFHTLDLTPSLGTLFSAFHKDSIQRKIRRAERENVTYHVGRSDTLLKDFYKLFLLTRKRHGLPPHPFRWFRYLVQCMGNALNIRVAFKNGHAIAAILTLDHKQTVTYKYGCSDARFSNLGGTQLLFWNCIQEAKRNGMNTLDLGRSNSANVGLITFKNRWGSTRSLLAYFRCAPSTGAMNLLIEHHDDWKLRLAGRVIANVPSRILSAVGDVLYKHAG